MAQWPRSPNPPTESQEEVIRFLRDRLSFGESVERVECIETHGAFVFLAGDRAYKLKRAVRLPYFDFSTIEKREAACRHELERNMPVAPEIYVGVEAIVRTTDGALRVGGYGTPVDWVVVMRRFAQEAVLDQLACRGELHPSLMAQLAKQISNAHAQAFRNGRGASNFDHVVSQTISALSQNTDVVALDRVQRYASMIVCMLNRHSHLLDSRARNGFVRLCHGDLHLRNIVLIDGNPTLFDAIEFDDNLATIDVLYDLAFLLMDLWHRRLFVHANLCFNEYVSRSVPNDALNGLAALPLFMATRAAVRTMVALDQRAVQDKGTQGSADGQIDTYFDLALKLLGAVQPQLIAIGGFSGTGKSVLASRLAPHIGTAPGAVHLRSDVERKRLLGLEPLDRLPQHAYTEARSDVVYRHLCARAEAALNAGQTVVVDAAFLTPRQRHAIEQVAMRARTPFYGLWLTAPTDILMDRVANRRGDASDANIHVLAKQLLSAQVASSWQQIDASSAPCSVFGTVCELLGLDSEASRQHET